MNIYYRNINIKTYLVRRFRRSNVFNIIFPLGTGGDPQYSFNIWIRHLEKLKKYSNENLKIPEIVAEIGPGSTLGAGLAALFSGANKYYALDVQNYINQKTLLKYFDEILLIFNSRKSGRNDFPSHILSEEILSKSLAKERINDIRFDLESNFGSSKYIKYFVPWTDEKLRIDFHIDFIFSQCVLEHVDNLEYCYESMNKWLKPGGYASHLVDFQSHAFTKHWNGHWAFSKMEWERIKGSNAWAINREPLSKHQIYAINSGFEILEFNRRSSTFRGINRNELNPEFSWLLDSDLNTAFIDMLLHKPM
jgi:SAM-dependent methyltransferase